MIFKLKKLFFILCFFLLITPLYPARAANLSPKESFLIKSNNPAATEKMFGELEIADFNKLEALNVYEVETTQEEINILAEQSSTIFIEKNNKVKISQLPNDPYYQLQTYLTNSNITSAWDISTGSPSIIAAVIDTGVDYNHEDLKNKMWKNANGYFGYDFVNSDNDPMDDNQHGTEIAGIIAAQSNNGIGMAGIANVKIMAVKAVPYTGEGDVMDLARGITYAADNGARVANVSLGLAEDSQALDDAITYARSKNCLIVAATGNLNRNFIDNPARNPNAVGVGAIDESGNKASYSNYGEGISLVALGNHIYSTSWNENNDLNAYQYGNGTSFATPQVTGTVALLASKDPSLTSDQIKKRLVGSAKKIAAMGGLNYMVQLGYGKLDAYTALTYDKYPPELNLNLYKNGGGIYTIKGTVSDDKKTTDVYPDTPDSNIAQVRYQVDGNGAWTTLNNNPIQLVTLNSNTSALPVGDHDILVEATDTAGNKANLNLNTRNATLLPVAISNKIADYSYSFVDQSPYVNTTAGQTVSMSLAVKNTGGSVWDKNTVHLGTANSNDRTSIFANQTWLSSNRIAMQEDSVAVGDIAHFNFSITVPGGVVGDFSEHFNLVADGIGWMNDAGIFWKVSVGTPSYHAQFVDQSPYPVINQGSTIPMWVDFKNSGSISWDISTVKLGTSNPLDRSSIFYNSSSGSGWKSANRISMAKNTVAPGETVRFNFTAHAPNTPGTYYEYFRPVADGVKWLEDIGLFWKITVN
ncbi:MAG: S8 family serine peptidase [Patescibacteria group bacterium]|nr:S8 family serine peptidase [Patescibacteria group bacterium]